MVAPVIAALPTAPDIADPNNFAADASVFVAALAPLRTDINLFGTYLNDGGFDGQVKLTTRSTYGGTANVITVTTGLSLGALVTGMEIRFRATAANTGATTINVDAIGAVTTLTITGAALTAGYIRTDVDTVIRYNGTNWIADRQIERGSNANGDYIKFADGSQQCWDIEDLGAPSTWSGTAGSRYKDRVWTYPSAFSVVPYGLCSGDQDQSGPGNVGTINTSVRDKNSNTTTAMKVGAREIITSSTGSVVLSVHAFGKWY